MLEINFLAGSNYLLPGIKNSSKLTYLVANTGSQVTGHCHINDPTELKNSLLFQGITFITDSHVATFYFNWW